ncbi:large-conductance mechanosensitive channel [Entophlyctis helioformis]|nr:large-conductance mechanosensitive channel [Entophlyctis helioformis]
MQASTSFKNSAAAGFKKVGSNLKGGAVKSIGAVGSVLDDFKTFLDRGNVIDLAVGIVIGAAFTSIVTSFVNDLISPIIGLATQNNLENNYEILRCPGNITDCRDRKGTWNTPAEANKAGIVTWNWGRFIQVVINFLIISAIVFFIVKVYAATFRRPAPKVEKDCPFCTKAIPLGARRCPLCTSHLDTDDLKVADETAVEVSKDTIVDMEIVPTVASTKPAVVQIGK